MVDKSLCKDQSSCVDPKYLGIPNICFSVPDILIPAGKDYTITENKYKQQRLERGFDDTETWSLSHTIALFCIPRLERYLEITKDMYDEEDTKVKMLLNAFKLYVKEEGYTPEEKVQIQEGLAVFPEIFEYLWW